MEHASRYRVCLLNERALKRLSTQARLASGTSLLTSGNPGDARTIVGW